MPGGCLKLRFRAVGQPRDVARAVSVHPVQIECAGLGAIRPKHNAPAVGRPHWKAILTGVEGQLRQRVPRPVVHPDVALLAVGDVHHQLLAVRREPRIRPEGARRTQHRPLAVARQPVDRARGRRGRAGHIHERALGRHRQFRAACGWKCGDAFKRRHRRAHRLEASEIETHREDRPLVQVDQMAAFALVALRRARPARHIPAGVPAAHDHLRRPARQWSDDEVRRVPVALRRRVLGVEHRLSARQRLRPPLPSGAGAESAENLRRAPSRRNAHQPHIGGCPRPREENRVVVGPRAAEVLGDAAEHDRGAPSDRDLLQRAAGKERQPLAVRREERIHSAFGAGERSGLQLVELADEQACRACLSRDEREGRAVRRQNRRRADGGRQRRVGADAGEQRPRCGHGGRLPGRPQHQQHAREDDRHARDRPRQGAPPQRTRWPPVRRQAPRRRPSRTRPRARGAHSACRRGAASDPSADSARSTWRSAGGRSAGSGVPRRLQLHDRRQRVGEVLARERARAGQHLEEHDAERPDVGALVDRLARAPARAPCRRRCRGSCPSAVIAGEVIVGELR